MRWSASALGLAFMALAGLSAPAEQPMDDNEAARAVIRKALDRAVWNEQQNVSAKLRSAMTRDVRHFNGDGEIETEELSEYEVIPIDGAPYERRLTMNGRPLNDEELEQEREREGSFRDGLAQPDDSQPEEDEDRIAFSEELIARYVFTLEGEEPLRGRPSDKVSFRPRPGELPVRRRIDYALNKAQGTVWIDRATHEAARVEFELIDKVRLWWGVLGTINHARGSTDRGPVLGDTWGRLQTESYTDVRVVFTRTRRAELQTWRDFEWVE